MVRVLELFSGTGSVSKVAKERGWEVVSLDLKDADINMSILDWDYKSYDGGFDVVWASPPCHTFSRLRDCWLGRTLKEHGDTVITREVLQQDILDKGLPLLNRALDIIQHFAPAYWFIENPESGRMKDYLVGYPMITVDYCMYSDWGYRKRTNIWTNIEDFKPLTCNKKCGNMIVAEGRKLHSKNCGNTERLRIGMKHRRSPDGGSNQRGTLGTSLRDRYRIPPKLIRALFECCQ